jgi:hypothetical protein
MSDLNQDFLLIQKKIKNKNFKIKISSSKPKSNISIYLESVNYMMYKFSIDHNDFRQIFPYIIIPDNIDLNLSKITLSEFIKFLSNNKSTKIEMIDINDIKYINDELDSFWN